MPFESSSAEWGKLYWNLNPNWKDEHDSSRARRLPDSYLNDWLYTIESHYWPFLFIDSTWTKQEGTYHKWKWTNRPRLSPQVSRTSSLGKTPQLIPGNFREGDNSLLCTSKTLWELESSTYYDYPELEDSEDHTISTSVPFSSLILQAMAGTGSVTVTAEATGSIFSSISTGRQGTGKETSKGGSRRGSGGGGGGRDSSRGGSSRGGREGGGGREGSNPRGTNNTGNFLKEWGELPPPIDGRSPEKTTDFTLQMAAYLRLNRQVYPTKEDKWYLIISRLQGGTAGSWATALVKIAISTNNYTYNATTLIDLIAKQFGVHDIIKDAAINIQIFCQRENESIRFFNNRFITNASLSGIQEDAALIQF